MVRLLLYLGVGIFVGQMFRYLHQLANRLELAQRRRVEDDAMDVLYAQRDYDAWKGDVDVLTLTAHSDVYIATMVRLVAQQRTAGRGHA